MPALFLSRSGLSSVVKPAAELLERVSFVKVTFSVYFDPAYFAKISRNILESLLGIASKFQF